MHAGHSLRNGLYMTEGGYGGMEVLLVVPPT